MILALAFAYCVLLARGLGDCMLNSFVVVIPFALVFLNAGSAVPNDAPTFACGVVPL